MNFYHLRYFLSVAQTGSFSRAARDMYVTQPTVSSGIAELGKKQWACGFLIGEASP